MEIVKNYLPAVIEFTAKTNEVPESLGTFETPEDVQKFISENFIAMPKQIETVRLLDDYEKEHIRNDYITELEENLPIYQHQLMHRAAETEAAKEAEKRAKETVSASFNKIETLSKEVRKGIAEINLDLATTYEIALNGNYYYYTFINGVLQLAKVMKIPEHQVRDLFNSSERNKVYFE
jgi:phosphopantothenoylcysteine synthetase/decarboxylase